MRFMITNGGPHPSDRWATVSADAIVALIQVNDASDNPEAKAARQAKPRFALDLADAFEKHHNDVQQGERGALETSGTDRFYENCDPRDHHPQTLDEAVAEVVTVAGKYPPFAEHFQHEQVQTAVRAILGSHFATSMDIERSWHADRRIEQGCQVSLAYRAARDVNGGGSAHAHLATALPRKRKPAAAQKR